MKNTHHNHACELDARRHLFKVHESEVPPEYDKWLVEQERLRTECNEKSFRCYVLLSPDCWLVLAFTLGEDSVKELAAKLQLSY